MRPRRADTGLAEIDRGLNEDDINIMNDGTVTKIKDTFEKHPVEAGEVEEVCEGEGDTEKGGGKVGSHLVGECPCLVVESVQLTNPAQERVRIQLNAERPNAEKRPRWILWRRQRISLVMMMRRRRSPR